MIKFDDSYPPIRNSELFSGRYEENIIIRPGSITVFPKLIKNLFPNCIEAKEILATTYFEPVLVLQPEQSCVVRFRQRGEFVKEKIFSPPKNWRLAGAGSLEIKTKWLVGINKGIVQKTATFLPDKKDQDIYTLLKLVKAKYPTKTAITKFINQANSRQEHNIFEEHSQLINPKTLLKTVPYLSLYATRVNLRYSFDVVTDTPIRITIETKPRFYAYPIDHSASVKARFKHSYKAMGIESPDREKIEIKTGNMMLLNEVLSHLAPYLEKYKIPGNKYTKKPYNQMIVDVSKKTGVLINEAPTRELEAKANLSGKTKPAVQIKKVWGFILKANNFPYKLFSTEPFVSLRGEVELDRTIFGWKNPDGAWEEAGTLIRMTDEGTKEYGFEAIIKWKTDYRNRTDYVLNRKEVYDYLKHNISNETFLKSLQNKTKKLVEIAGVIHKLKYRIYIQDVDGRVFCLSLDECKMRYSPKILKQLEIEYLYTILTNQKKVPVKPISLSCDECMQHIKSVLKKTGITAVRTKQRKIDFVASQRSYYLATVKAA